MANRFLFGVILMLFLPGCYFAPKYPQQWSKPVAADSPIEELLVGAYQNGQSPNPDSKNAAAPFSNPFRLLDFLEIEGVTASECDTIRVHRPQPGRLHIIAMRGEEQLGQRQLTAGKDYVVRAGWLRLKADREFVNDGGAFGFSSRVNAFTLTESNDLILKMSDSGTGIMLLIPVVAHERKWFMFERVRLTPQPTAEEKPNEGS